MLSKQIADHRFQFLTRNVVTVRNRPGVARQHCRGDRARDTERVNRNFESIGTMIDVAPLHDRPQFELRVPKIGGIAERKIEFTAAVELHQRLIKFFIGESCSDAKFNVVVLICQESCRVTRRI